MTLSGGNNVRVLYMDTCDQAQHWTLVALREPRHAQPHGSKPHVRRRQLHWARHRRRRRRSHLRARRSVPGDQLTLLSQRVRIDGGRHRRRRHSRCSASTTTNRSTSSTAPLGASMALGNVCSNGGALSSIGVSYTVINSLLADNRAIGMGANPAQSGTPGGGSGGAIYNDGDTYTLTAAGDDLHRQHGHRRRRGDLLRQQRSHRLPCHRQLDPHQQPQRNVRDRRLPGCVRSSERPAADYELDAAINQVGPSARTVPSHPTCPRSTLWHLRNRRPPSATTPMHTHAPCGNSRSAPSASSSATSERAPSTPFKNASARAA